VTLSMHAMTKKLLVLHRADNPKQIQKW